MKMKYEEVQAEKALELSPHHHAYINPYTGCSMGCPFCFWLSMEGWEGRIGVRKNLPELLRRELKDWPKDEFLYLGSICDPFNEMEEQYGIAQECLKVIEEYQIPVLITSSAVQPVILKAAETLKQMKSPVILVTELARIPEVERMKRGENHRGIEHANQLKSMGLNVYATIAPICPGIIDLEPILKKLDTEIPVYVDSLQCAKDSIQENRVMEWIQRDYPELLGVYERIVMKKDLSYFEEILKTYGTDARVKTFPYDLKV